MYDTSLHQIAVIYINVSFIYVQPGMYSMCPLKWFNIICLYLKKRCFLFRGIRLHLSAMWVFMCVLRLTNCVKALLHESHLLGFSPVCVVLCSFNLDDREKACHRCHMHTRVFVLCVFFGVFSNHLNLNKHIHKIHTCKVSLQCVFFDGLSKHIHKILIKAYSQNSHLYGFSSVCILWWVFKLLFCENAVSHNTCERHLTCMCLLVSIQMGRFWKKLHHKIHICKASLLYVSFRFVSNLLGLKMLSHINNIRKVSLQCEFSCVYF